MNIAKKIQYASCNTIFKDDNCVSANKLNGEKKVLIAATNPNNKKSHAFGCLKLTIVDDPFLFTSINRIKKI